VEAHAPRKGAHQSVEGRGAGLFELQREPQHGRPMVRFVGRRAGAAVFNVLPRAASCSPGLHSARGRKGPQEGNASEAGAWVVNAPPR
jgi:hypothetical protein